MSERIVGKHLAALVVPLTEDDLLDEVALRSLCNHMSSIEGIDGLVVNAHAGEVDSLTYEERIQVAKAVAEGDVARGVELHHQIEPLVELLFNPPMIKMPSRVKEVLHYLGLIPNARVRPPLPQIGEEERNRLIQAMKGSGFFE